MHPLLLASLLCGPALSSLALAQSSAPGAPEHSAATPSSEPAALATLPSDAELEAAGARIGAIQIRTKEIFDLDNPHENNWLFRTADRLHVRTRESAIRAQLLFRSGDRYSRRLLEETARNMRKNSDFLREPEIRPLRYHDGLVDIEVVTHDVWTLQPGINYGRSGGTNRTSAEFSDDNFLGFGKFIQLGHGQDVDRTSTYAQWRDPNVWGSHWRDGLLYSDNSDGRVWSIMADHPFYSLETRYTGGGGISEDRGVVTRYRLGQSYDAYERDWRQRDFYFGKALNITGRWTQRVIAGWHVDDSAFGAAPNHALLAPLPQQRDLSYPFARLQWIQNTYAITRNLDQIAFTEDLHFGLDASLGLGWAAPAFGADRRALLADTEVAYGWPFGPQHQLFVTSRLASRFEQGNTRDATASGSASYYVATSERSKLLVRLSGDAGHNLDGDHYFELGGDTGLRGYPLRYQNGNQRALFTLEERLYTRWFLWQLVHVGAAAFFDMGRTWGTTPVPTPQLGLLKDAGVGLRLGNARSSFGSVVHIDLAAPLNADKSISKLQLVVTTEQTF